MLLTNTIPSQEDISLGDSGYHIKIVHREGWYVVAAVNRVREYTWWMCNMAQNNCPRIISKGKVSNPLQRLNLLSYRLLEIQKTPCHRHPALVAALKPILMVTMSRVAESLRTIINTMIYWNDFKIVNMLEMENPDLSHKDVNTRVDKPEYRFNIQHVLQDSITSRVKPTSDSTHSYCVLSFCPFDKFHPFQTKHGVGWLIAMKARIWFKLQVTATTRFLSLFDLCYQSLWLIPAPSEHAVEDVAMPLHGAEVLYSAVKSLMHAIWTGREEDQQDVVYRMTHTHHSWTIRQWSLEDHQDVVYWMTHTQHSWTIRKLL